MHYVYILKSKRAPEKFYVGYTDNLIKRLKCHNTGNSRYTKNYLPWKIETYIALSDENLAKSFEKYLKKGSGFAFLKKRLVRTES